MYSEQGFSADPASAPGLTGMLEAPCSPVELALLQAPPRLVRLVWVFLAVFLLAFWVSITWALVALL